MFIVHTNITTPSLFDSPPSVTPLCSSPTGPVPDRAGHSGRSDRDAVHLPGATGQAEKKTGPYSGRLQTGAGAQEQPGGKRKLQAPQVPRWPLQPPGAGHPYSA